MKKSHRSRDPGEQAAGLTAATTSPGIAVDLSSLQSSMPAADACRSICQQYLIQLTLYENSVQGNEVQTVNNARGAVRRMRVALRLYGETFHQHAISGFIDDLGRTGRMLGAVHEMDMALAKAWRAHQTSAQPGSSLLHGWQEQRDRAWRKLLAWLNDEDYGAFKAVFADFCATPGLGTKNCKEAWGSSTQLRHVAPALLMNDFVAIRSYEQVLPAAGTAHLEIWHALRVDSRRLLYHLEFLRHLLGNAGEQLIACLNVLQNLLDDLNHAVDSQHMLADALSRRKSKPTTAYLSVQVELGHQLAAQAPPLLFAFVAPEMRQCLGSALAQL